MQLKDLCVTYKRVTFSKQIKAMFLSDSEDFFCTDEKDRRLFVITN